MFDAPEPERPPVSPEEFEKKIDRYDGETIEEKIGSAVDEVWPAPDYREYQREAVVQIVHKLYVEDDDVVLLSSPTGSGKSLLLYTATAVVDEVLGRKSFSTTPLNTLVDQIENDELLSDTITLKGRSNYSCVHPADSGTSVDSAICQRDDDFDCQYKDMPHTNGGCPYYGRKHSAKSNPKLVTNLSLLMANSMIPDMVDAGFDQRELLTVDECQSVDDFALLFVGVTIGEHNVPIDWDSVSSLPTEDDSMKETVEWIENELLRVVTNTINDLESRKESFTFSSKEQEQLDDLRRFKGKIDNFLHDQQENHWAKTHSTFGGERKIEFEPIKVGRFLGGYLWNQSNKIICASATIPPNFTEEVGLDDRTVGRIEIPSTFPKERRPIVTDRDVGKMTMSERDRTIPKMADEIARIANEWEGHAGIVHANSYKIGERLYDRLPRDVRDRTRLQDSDDREGSLRDWVGADVHETGQTRDRGGQLFISVAQEEGISLDDDQARFNIVAKVSYPFMGDERVSYRMDDDTMGGAEWQWYLSQSASSLQQSAGRTTRSKDDWSITYLLDTSAVQLIERNKELFENWFLEAVGCDYDDSVVTPDNGGSSEGEGSESSQGSQSSLDDIADQHFG